MKSQAENPSPDSQKISHPFAALVKWKAEKRDPEPLLKLAEETMKRCPTTRRIDFICALNLAAERLFEIHG